MQHFVIGRQNLKHYSFHFFHVYRYRRLKHRSAPCRAGFLLEEGVDPVYALGFSLLAAFCVDLIFLSQVAFVFKTVEQEAVSACFGLFFQNKNGIV